MGTPNTDTNSLFDQLQEQLRVVIKERDGLRVERERLLSLLRVAVSPTHCYCDVLNNRKCWQCETRAVLATSDQKERRSE